MAIFLLSIANFNKEPNKRMFEELFREILLLYSAGQEKDEHYWIEIVTWYTDINRHYHSLKHLDNMGGQLLDVKDKIRDWDVMIFAVAYHDLIYKTLKQDNEERSAAIAEDRLKQLNLPKEKIEKCVSMILATKNHEPGSDSDTAYLVDADLAVLGADPSSYLYYVEQIRKENKHYPDFLYNPGRKKVLNNFLQRERIFHTEEFYRQYELQARSNIRNELQLL